jgi:transposase
MTNIPPKRNRKDPICFSPYLDRARNLIERFLNKIKQCRRPGKERYGLLPPSKALRRTSRRFARNDATGS